MHNYKYIVDIHNHIYPDGIAEKAINAIGSFYEDSPMKGKGTMNDLLLSGKEACIENFVVSSAATTPNQVEVINNFMASLSAPNTKLIRFGTIHPEIKSVDRELERIKSLSLQGIKLHPDFQRFNIDDPSMFPIYKSLEGNLPILFHIGDRRLDYSNPERLARIIDMFPGLTVIAAHLGGYRVWDKLGSILIGKNVYIDTSSALMFMEPEQAVKIIRAHGVDKVLYGTDYPMWSHNIELKRFLSLGLSYEENMRILSTNALELFC
ncbi:Amidohydrolase 2 [Candidatus Desulfosporosinus infrequens]|uniref:Amidohydrolase 2 n=1 Tax=Candidatus Desulfosporosinus infrequens TaxID=2043169 RepID=A0A2U3LST8_9FIRM|nr:Amidohydrolase 2 [Candidatus Desulfosporosinus infrequens]